MRLVSWLRDFVEVNESPEEIAEKLALRGFEVASIEALDGGDAVIDFEVTANRPIASACSASRARWRRRTTCGSPRRVTAPARMRPRGGFRRRLRDRHRVTIEDDELCPRYAAAVADLTPAASPTWMTSRLQAAGRPADQHPIVDITNYVLFELGQPMHAFDLDKLAGAEIRVRRARPGETITTLDGVERKLDPEMLVIADRDRAQAVAGVMGGAHSEVSAATTRIVFESAYFKPASVRRTSKRLGLKTEASARFERGADIDVAVVAIERALRSWRRSPPAVAAPDRRSISRAARSADDSPAPGPAGASARRKGRRRGRRSVP